MIEPLVSVKIHGSSRVFLPGDELSGEVQIDAVEPADLLALEISILWHTQGKGDEDLGVHFFQRITPECDPDAPLSELRGFRTVLPNSPLSYDGRIVKVGWCVRVRAFVRGGRELVADQPFQLGGLTGSFATAQSIDPPADADQLPIGSA
jgi:hypothetical protein